MADVNKAISDLNAAGWTRKDIKAALGVTTEDIQNVLGKSTRGRKPKKEKVADVVKAVKDNKSKDTIIVDVIAIDASASMRWVEKETANGVNKYLSDMRESYNKTGVEAFAGVVQFGLKHNKVQRAMKMTHVDKINIKFDPRSESLTPLNEAVVESINMAQEFIAKKGLKQADVTVTVFTDGGENCSKNSIRETAMLVKACKNKGWTIAFVGPNGSKHYAESLDVDHVLEYDISDKKNFTRSYDTMSKSRAVKTDAIALGKFSTESYFVED